MSNVQTRRILLAGAGGAVGQRLCKLLFEDGWLVIGTTRSASKTALLRNLGVEPVVVDVFDEESLNRIVAEARPEVVIHQLTDLPPALNPARMPEALVRNAHLRDVGTRNLVTAAVAAGARRLIAQSIAFTYAPGPEPYTEASPLNPESRGVIRLEQQVLNAPLEGIVLRYGRFYGPGTGFDQPTTGGAVHVDAAAEAARLAITFGKPGVYNIAEANGPVSSQKAMVDLRWKADFRLS